MSSIADARRSLSLTQAELATMLGLNQSTISRFERGELPVDERTKLALEAIQARHAAASVSAEAA
jgi:transcriptional regulator with XRE-family HTH domain